MVTANDRVLDWISQTTQIDNSCINLLQDMELGQEEGDFFESQNQDVSQEELSAHLDPVPLSRQNKKWGPVAGTRQSSWLFGNEGKSMLQLAQELAQKKYLEKVVPASSKVTGISSSNLFEVISPYKFIDIANIMGIDTSIVINNRASPVDDDIIPVKNSSHVHLKGPDYDEDFPDALGWSSIKKKTRRGKHRMIDSFK
jgi:hypothetical protein